MQFSVYQESHIGGRKVNQDRMGYSYSREALLLVLADGMGGHACGELAASMAVKTLSTLFQRHAQPYVKKPQRFLEHAFLAAHQAIQLHCQAAGLRESACTTLVACLIQHDAATWAHCGDSRLYWMRGGKLLARTQDHSHVERLIARGLVPETARASHPERNRLYNCLGASVPPEVRLSAPASLLPGDVMLLCSDGLWAVLPETELMHRLHTQAVVHAVPELLRSALAAAGPTGDNATALAIMWQGSPVRGDAPSTPDGGHAAVASGEAPPPHTTFLQDNHEL